MYALIKINSGSFKQAISVYSINVVLVLCYFCSSDFYQVAKTCKDNVIVNCIGSNLFGDFSISYHW